MSTLKSLPRSGTSSMQRNNHRGDGNRSRDLSNNRHDSRQNGNSVRRDGTYNTSSSGRQNRDDLSSPVIIPQRTQNKHQNSLHARATINGNSKSQINDRSKPYRSETLSTPAQKARKIEASPRKRPAYNNNDNNDSTHSKESSDRSNVRDKDSRNQLPRRDARPNVISGTNRRNRHETESWRRRDRTPSRGPRRSSPALSGSSLSKRSETSTRSSRNSSSSTSSARDSRFKKKDDPSARNSRRSRSSSTSASADPSSRKRQKLNLEVEKGPAKSSPKQPSSNGHAATPAPTNSQPTTQCDWTIQTSSAGRQYYYNQKTKISQWHKPEGWPGNEVKPAEDRKPPTVESVSDISVVTQDAAKRKLDDVDTVTEITPNPKPAKILKTINASLLGSPISDDDNSESNVATQSEKMDISDDGQSSISKRPKKFEHKAASSYLHHHKPPRDLNSKKASDISPDSKRTKAPTVEDLRKLDGTDDPERRRTVKLERVTTWMAKLEVVTDTRPPADICRSPVVQEPGSPVSSECSRDSLKLGFLKSADARFDVSTGSVETQKLLSAAPGTSSPSPLPPRGCGNISLPSFDFPDLPNDPLKHESSQFFNANLTMIFRSLKLEGVEDQRSQYLLEKRPLIYCRTGEKTVLMKTNNEDIRQKRTTTLSQADDITFLTGLEDELLDSMQSRSDAKAELQKSIKAETSDVDVKEESLTIDPEKKSILVSTGTDLSS